MSKTKDILECIGNKLEGLYITHIEYTGLFKKDNLNTKLLKKQLPLCIDTITSNDEKLIIVNSNSDEEEFAFVCSFSERSNLSFDKGKYTQIIFTISRKTSKGMYKEKKKLYYEDKYEKDFIKLATTEEEIIDIFKDIDTDEEIWKSPPNLSKYLVSTHGRIRNIKSGRIMTATPNPSGYIRVHCSNDMGKSEKYPLHQLVALTFIDNPLGKKYVDHINRVRHCNYVKNLRWVTILENSQNVSKPSGLKVRAVNQYDLDGNITKQWPSIISIINKLIITRESIAKACKTGNILLKSSWAYVDSIPIPGEEWKTIEINGHIIQASSAGRLKTASNNIIYGYNIRSGYKGATINGKEFLVHRIICQAFFPIDNPELYQVNHKDSDKKNNCKDNLEWCTNKDNQLHSIIARGTAKSLLPVRQYSLTGNLIKEFSTMREAFLSLGKRSNTDMVKVCDRKTLSCAGFIWRYASEKLKRVKPIHEKQNRRSVDMYSSDVKNYIKTFCDAKEAANEVSLKSEENILAVCEGRKKFAGGYFWRYTNTYEDGESEEETEEKPKKKKAIIVVRKSKYTKEE